MSLDILSFYHKLPKAELHVHLEGSVCAQDLLTLATQYSQAPITLAEIKHKLKFECFSTFLATWTWKNDFLRSYADFTFIAKRFAERQKAQNIVYTEAFYSPSDFARHGLTVGGITQAIHKGLQQVTGVTVKLICDLVRNNGPQGAQKILTQVQEVKAYDVIGIGIGGSEAPYPAELFENVFTQAAEMGFERTAHAGEACGADSIKATVALGVSRIGHGIRAWDDISLVTELTESGITLEICPSSNILTQAPGYDWSTYPLKQLVNAGVICTINTDDPDMFDTHLAKEFMLCETKLGMSRELLINLARNAFKSAWMPKDMKERYLKKFDETASSI